MTTGARDPEPESKPADVVSSGRALSAAYAAQAQPPAILTTDLPTVNVDTSVDLIDTSPDVGRPRMHSRWRSAVPVVILVAGVGPLGS